MKLFNRFLNVESFDCDKCKRKFKWTTAYSVARDWDALSIYPTLCFDCVKLIEKKGKLRLRTPSKLDKRTLNKTGRIHQLGTRVRKEFLKKLKAIARKEKLKYVEVLERALDYYEKH